VSSSSTNFKGGNCPKLKNGETVIVRGMLTSEGIVDATEIEFGN
jgi:cytochrome c-type biogenesis protein CcmE